MSNPTIPAEMQSLHLSSFSEPLTLQTKPVPAATPGSILVRVLACNVLAYANEVYTGKRQYNLPLPSTIGSGSIARVVSVGEDSTSLKPNDLVLIDIFIKARDVPSTNFLLGTHSGVTSASQTLAAQAWRDGTYATYARVPLENAYVLDEAALLQKRGYKVHDLCYILRLLVPMGGLYDLGVRAGETVLIAPATGSFGGAAVAVALAMGARVVAAGRNGEALESIAASFGEEERGRLRTVVISTDDVEGDMKKVQDAVGGKPIDAYVDFSPPNAAKSTHIRSCLLALRPGGRACFMGGIMGNVEIPYFMLMVRNLQLRGRFMFDRPAVLALIGMVEAGLVKIGEQGGIRTVGPYALEKWQEAFDAAEKNGGYGVQVIIAP